MQFDLFRQFTSVHRQFLPSGDNFKMLHRSCTLEDSGERIIIGRRNRIELVIVASSASQRETHEGSADRIDLFVDDVHLHFYGIVFCQHFGTERKESGSNHCV